MGNANNSLFINCFFNKKLSLSHHEFERSGRCQELVAIPQDVIKPAVGLQFIDINICHYQGTALQKAGLKMTTELLEATEKFQ